MRKITTILLVLAALFLSLSAAGQNNRGPKDWQDRMKAEKIAFLTDAMDLTSAEAERFWPVYNRAEAEKREAFERSLRAIRDLDEGIKAGKDDKEIGVLLEKFLNSQNANAAIDAKYLSEYRKILSNKKITQLFLGEENFRRQQIHRLNRNDNNRNDKK